MSKQSEMENGELAFEMGQSIYTNPHAAYTVAHDYWRWGWEDACANLKRRQQERKFNELRDTPLNGIEMLGELFDLLEQVREGV